MNVTNQVVKLLAGQDLYPAGDMEAFFTKVIQLNGLPPPQELEQLFAVHGMKIMGPLLQVA